jgi:hypothetical protein
MSGITLITGTLASLKSAFDISKAMIGIRDAVVINEKVVELQRVILAAQSDAMAAQSDQFALLERVRSLEQQIAEMKDWDTEKQRYDLKQVDIGAFAYSLKSDAGGSEPPHWICTTCYKNDKNSILQQAVVPLGR